MTKLVMNVPDTADGTPVEVVGYGLFLNGEEVDLGYDVLDAQGAVVSIVYAYNPPVKKEDTDASEESDNDTSWTEEEGD